MKFIKDFIILFLISSFLVLVAVLIRLSFETPFDQWSQEVVRILTTRMRDIVLIGLIITSTLVIFRLGHTVKPAKVGGKLIFKYTIGARLLAGVFFILPAVIGFGLLYLSGDFTANVGLGISSLIFFTLVMIMYIGLYLQIYKLVVDGDKIMHLGMLYRWRTRSLENLTTYDAKSNGNVCALSFKNEKPLGLPFFINGSDAFLKLLDAQIEKNKNA